MSKEKYIGGIGYRLYKSYVRFVNEHIMYHKVYYLNRENVPALGEPCMIVSNHQNCANDPLNLLLGLENESHPFVIARGNVFSWHPLITKFFLWLGMLPAFRLNFDGAESLKKNAETIRISGGKMLEGNRLIMYPEGGHQDKHWLGEFSYGYTRMAFETAESDNFEHDIKILPCAHHYKDYFAVQSEVMIQFGTPISLEPYYELYKTKPRTAQREVNKLVRNQIESMMLDVRDLEHYDAIDWLRNSEFGYNWCKEDGVNTSYLPDKLKVDKLLVEKLSKLEGNELYDEMLDIKSREEAIGVTEVEYYSPMSWLQILLSIICLILLLPLWLVSLYPNIVHYNIYRPFMKTDKMFTNSWRFIIPVVVGVPFWFMLTVLLCGLLWGWWWQSIVLMLLSFYPLSVFAIKYWDYLCRVARNIKLLCCSKQVGEISRKRADLFDKLKKIIK